MMLIPPRVPNRREDGLLHFDLLPPLSLYVHIPWCVKKCPYCDFYSHAISSAVPEERYLTALEQDLEASLPLIKGRQVSTVFIGGGTPSLLSDDAINKLLVILRNKLLLTPDVEITLEANPGTFDDDKIKAYREAGVNRLSIGIQSFNQKHLDILGRIHDVNQAKRAVEIAMTHFDNVNLDLMYALPHQTKDDLDADLTMAISYDPAHLSLYQLTIEQNTYFAFNPPDLPDEDTVADMQDMIEMMTATAGYAHYEVSAYAKPGRACRHNINYWLFGDYLGIGSGAHSKITVDGKVIRQTRFEQPPTYMLEAGKGRAVDEEFTLSHEDLGFEFMLNALRLTKGFYPEMFEERTALPLDSIRPYLKQAEKRGLLYRDPTIIRPTEKGMLFLNDLQQIFLPDE
ncbi:MAG: oxygen-independent coproporphyrinogen III oxidase-like protein [Oxalobacter sp.]|nr:oxygen-independent coproporphyrinogen III oxidase-like protein [Oxalobacter sp.]